MGVLSYLEQLRHLEARRNSEPFETSLRTGKAANTSGSVPSVSTPFDPFEPSLSSISEDFQSPGGMDDRRPCILCARLRRGRCLAAGWGQIPNAAHTYHPDPSALHRCASFKPGQGEASVQPVNDGLREQLEAQGCAVLPDDVRFIQQKIAKHGQERRESLLSQYIARWKKAAAHVPPERYARNIGRFAANSWLREYDPNTSGRADEHT